jgi:hypothetical protein
MTTLDDAAQLGAKERGHAVISTLRGDCTISSSVVNVGVMTHPLVDQRVLGFVTYGWVKLANLRVRPKLTATFRSGCAWAAVEGYAQLIGPDDPHAQIGISGYDFCCVRPSRRPAVDMTTGRSTTR